jgi:hypothetical protein
MDVGRIEVDLFQRRSQVSVARSPCRNVIKIISASRGQSRPV